TSNFDVAPIDSSAVEIRCVGAAACSFAGDHCVPASRKHTVVDQGEVQVGWAIRPADFPECLTCFLGAEAEPDRGTTNEVECPRGKWKVAQDCSRPRAQFESQLDTQPRITVNESYRKLKRCVGQVGDNRGAILGGLCRIHRTKANIPQR